MGGIAGHIRDMENDRLLALNPDPLAGSAEDASGQSYRPISAKEKDRVLARPLAMAGQIRDMEKMRLLNLSPDPLAGSGLDACGRSYSLISVQAGVTPPSTAWSRRNRGGAAGAGVAA